MNNKQLYEKLGQNSYDKVFPITYLQNILDKDTNNDLTVVLSRFNHLWIPYQGAGSRPRHSNGKGRFVRAYFLCDRSSLFNTCMR